MSAAHEKCCALASCGKSRTEAAELLQLCCACNVVTYCSRACQRAHRKSHRAFCDAAAIKRFNENLASAETGDVSAQFLVGTFYDNGLGVPKSANDAVLWYGRAADAGHAGAQFNLAILYRDGIGVAKDPEQSVVWYRLAAEAGHCT